LDCVAFHLVCDSGDGVRVTVATGGHPLPLVLRTDGMVEEAGSPGTLLGVFEDPELTDVVVQLGPGDAILLYTDGVTESRGDGPIYGEERLKELLATCAGAGAQQIADRVEADVVAYQPNVPDDIAILAIRVRD
jgi:sigma-B regulation protein RsbU (phosphoserine phosphatase)